MTADPRSLVLLSGGIDSAACLALACRRGGAVALTVDYGQPQRQELECSRLLAAAYRVEWRVVGVELAPERPARPAAPAEDPEGDLPAPTHYVPARNLVLLAVAMSVAESLGLDHVYLGSNRDDARYPDSRADFATAFAHAASLGTQRGRTGRPIHVRTPLVGLSKTDVVRAASALGVPLELTWSCYGGGDRPCGCCPACRLRHASFVEAGVDDPWGR